MASIFIGINRGQFQTPGNVTEGAATGSTDIELRIDTGKGTTRQDIELALELFHQYINDGLFGTVVFNNI